MILQIKYEMQIANLIFSLSSGMFQIEYKYFRSA